MDNIPGMTGVGERRRQALLQGIGSIDQIAANLDKVAAPASVAPRRLPTSSASRSSRCASPVLATIKTDVELEQSLEELELGPIDKEALLAVYHEYELRNLIKELESGSEESGAEGDEKAPPR